VKIVVVNSGSSSLKYQLFDMECRVALATGMAERIGDEGSRLVHRQREGVGRPVEVPTGDIPDHGAAIDRIATVARAGGLVEEGTSFGAIGHRVVHGGETFREATLIDETVLEAIRECSRLAPLHNPANLLGIELALERQPGVPQVAVFDTAFHQTLPPKAYRYAIPEDWYAGYNVRRYGFHGTSHAYVARQAAALLGRPIGELNLITLHLGNGASACAVEGGCSVETSMGLTPLEGLVMGTRSGDLDPSVAGYIAGAAGLSPDKLEAALNRESGLEGLCGDSDLREVLEREASGDERAKLAVDVYVHRIRKYVGAYTAVLGRVDGLVFTAGVGANSPDIRQRVCDGLEGLGIRIDPARNRGDGDGPRAIHADGGAVAILVVPTNEELEIAEQTLRCVQGDRESEKGANHDDR
jgi:acetate kinase